MTLRTNLDATGCIFRLTPQNRSATTLVKVHPATFRFGDDAKEVVPVPRGKVVAVSTSTGPGGFWIAAASSPLVLKTTDDELSLSLAVLSVLPGGAIQVRAPKQPESSASVDLSAACHRPLCTDDGAKDAADFYTALPPTTPGE
jgi:hypothetical protein